MERRAAGRRTANPRSAFVLRALVAASAGGSPMSGTTIHAQELANAATDNTILEDSSHPPVAA